MLTTLDLDPDPDPNLNHIGPDIANEICMGNSFLDKPITLSKKYKYVNGMIRCILCLACHYSMGFFVLYELFLFAVVPGVSPFFMITLMCFTCVSVYLIPILSSVLCLSLEKPDV